MGKSREFDWVDALFLVSACVIFAWVGVLDGREKGRQETCLAVRAALAKAQATDGLLALAGYDLCVMEERR